MVVPKKLENFSDFSPKFKKTLFKKAPFGKTNSLPHPSTYMPTKIKLK
jgi:hypothetical protein